MRIHHVLVSVYDKTGIVDFARELISLGVKIIATSGTLKFLKGGGVQFVEPVSNITQFPEILEGRIKTQHPKVLAGILALRKKKAHTDELERLGIRSIDMVVCNFYPLKKMIDRGLDFEIVLEHVDIGGPSLVRAAAKNFKNVVVLVNPEKYGPICQELKNIGDISIKTRSILAIEAFKEITRYDNLIYTFLKTISVRG